MNILHATENIKDSQEYKAMIDVLTVMLLSGTSMVEKLCSHL